MPVEAVGHEPVMDWPRFDESRRQKLVEFFRIDAQVADAGRHGAAFDTGNAVEKLGGVAADRVHDLPDVVERNAARTAAVVDACGEFMFQDVLHGATKVRSRERVAVFVREERRRATGAEPVRNPVDGAGASARRIVHRERHAENHYIRVDGGNRVFGLGLVLAVIVDGVFRIGLDVRAVRLRLFVAAEDHVGRNSDERRVMAHRKSGGIDTLAVVQEAAARGVAFAGLEGAIPARVDDSAKVESFKKFAQTFRFFGVDSKDVVSKDARVLDGADADNARCSVQFVEMPEERVARNAVQPENQNREAYRTHLERVFYFCVSFHLK